MIARRGISIIEIIVAAFLLGGVILIFAYLIRTSFLASSKGETSALARETARTILDRIQLELRQAAPVPGGGIVNVPAVILPGPGGTLTSSEQSAVGCSVATGCVTAGKSILNSYVSVPTPTLAATNAGPSGFLIFSELKQTQAAGGNIYISADPNYMLRTGNYVWVMFQVNPPSGNLPAQLVRYTFNVRTDGTDIGSVPGGWVRTDNYFVPANSIETANGIAPLVIATLTSPTTDRMWLMASHPAATASVQSTTGMRFDPQLFVITAIVQEASQMTVQSNAPIETATVSSQVKVEGGEP